MNEEKRKLVIRLIAWAKGWNMLEESSAVQDLLTEYELLKLEVADKREDG